MASTYLSRTLGTPTNNKKWTFSAWVKKGHIGGNINTLFSAGGDNANYFQIWTNYNNGQIQYYSQSGGSTAGSMRLSNRLRDISGWYHIVVSYDSANSTASERLKIYINGNQELDTSSGGDLTYPTQNASSLINSAIEHTIGKDSYRNDAYLDGSVSHLHFIDGTIYGASAFGSTDSTTGEWKINTSPSVTYGNNGFFILKDGNSVTDSSTNSNNFTVAGGTLTKTEDCPDNVFATMNPLDNYYTNSVFSNGNNSITTNNNARTFNNSTLGMTSGKYYCEMKSAGVDAGAMVGIIATSSTGTTFRADVQPYSWQYINTGSMRNNNNTQSGTWNTWTSGDIIGIALDLDNSKIYFSKNGVWQNTGSTNPSTGTDGFSITAVSSLPGDQAGCYFFNCSDNSTSSNLSYFNWNFGNGYFGTTAVSSAGTNASGNGIFEYDTPTGFTALSTKGLNL